MTISYKIAWADEAGRWCWAWPIFWAAVVIPEGFEIPEEIKDSKQLSEKKRDLMYDYIIQNYIFAITSISAQEIDTFWLQWANKQVMSQSVEKLVKQGVNIEKTIIDGTLKFESFPTTWESLIDGDALVAQISAASILAKVSRDRYLKELALKYPEYAFDKHKGYWTKLHIEALSKFWVIEEHRKSYKPIKAFIN